MKIKVLSDLPILGYHQILLTYLGEPDPPAGNTTPTEGSNLAGVFEATQDRTHVTSAKGCTPTILSALSTSLVLHQSDPENE